MPPELLGPLGLTAAALVAIAVLWRSHVQSDADLKADRDYWRDLALNGTALARQGVDLAARKR